MSENYFGNVTSRFNSEYEESFFKSEKTNFAFFAQLVKITYESKGIHLPDWGDMKIISHYLKQYLKENNNSFEDFGDLQTHVIKCVEWWNNQLFQGLVKASKSFSKNAMIVVYPDHKSVKNDGIVDVKIGQKFSMAANQNMSYKGREGWYHFTKVGDDIILDGLVKGEGDPDVAKAIWKDVHISADKSLKFAGELILFKSDDLLKMPVEKFQQIVEIKKGSFHYAQGIHISPSQFQRIFNYMNGIIPEDNKEIKTLPILQQKPQNYTIKELIPYRDFLKENLEESVANNMSVCTNWIYFPINKKSKRDMHYEVIKRGKNIRFGVHFESKDSNKNKREFLKAAPIIESSINYKNWKTSRVGSWIETVVNSPADVFHLVNELDKIFGYKTKS